MQERNNFKEYLSAFSNLLPLQIEDAEVGVFNWVLTQADQKKIPRKWNNPLFKSLYVSKAKSVACNLDNNCYVNNSRLEKRLNDNEFLPHNIASMTPDYVFPERWREVIETKIRRDEYITNARPPSMTDQYKCSRCKRRECSYMELQMRSCDEPMSLFIQCLSCGHHWRMG